MSDLLNKAVEELSARVAAGGLDGSVKFVVEEEGAIRLEGEAVTIDDADADCTISASAEVFEGIFTGEVNPTTAFMTGKITVEGDMSKAMALASVLA